MVQTLTLGVFLPEEYTPQTMFDTKAAEIDARLVTLEAADPTALLDRVSALEATVASLTTELNMLKQSAALASDVDQLTTDLRNVESVVGENTSSLNDFNFKCGTVADYEAAGTLAARDIFFLVDTPANLETVTAAQEKTADTKQFGVVLGW